MTEVEQAYNMGIVQAIFLLHMAADAMPPQHALPPAGLRDLADQIEGMKFADPSPPVAEVA